MLHTLAHIIRPLVPASLYRSVHSHVGRQNARKWLRDEGVLALGLQVAERFDYTVQTGLFKGMKYTPNAVSSRHSTPALIGQYEHQIHSHIMAAANRCDFVIDIGHAEGFYAVGLARLGKRVVAFDSDHHERRICREMAAVNGVSDLVEIRRWCDGEALRSLVEGRRALIISDIEGGEFDLFTPEVISSIRHCDLVVELHSRSAQENDSFVSRFRNSFNIELVGRPAAASGVDLVSFLGPDALRMATEYTFVEQWMIATPV